MSDIHCAQCGEPWGADYVHHEMHALDRPRFLTGMGCEACDFGRSCTHCSGTGRAKFDRRMHPPEEDCDSCLGGRFLIIRQLVGTRQPERWGYGYLPNVRTIHQPEIIFRYRGYSTRDGLVHSAKAHCPDCRETAPACPVCAGSGRLQPVPEGAVQAAVSELQASDGEPTSILARRARR